MPTPCGVRSRSVPCLVRSAQRSVVTARWFVGLVRERPVRATTFPVCLSPVAFVESVRFLIGQDHPEAGPCVRIPAATDSRRYSRRTASTEHCLAIVPGGTHVSVPCRRPEQVALLANFVAQARRAFAALSKKKLVAPPPSADVPADEVRAPTRAAAARRPARAFRFRVPAMALVAAAARLSARVQAIIVLWRGLAWRLRVLACG